MIHVVTKATHGASECSVLRHRHCAFLSDGSTLPSLAAKALVAYLSSTMLNGIGRAIRAESDVGGKISPELLHLA